MEWSEGKWVTIDDVEGRSTGEIYAGMGVGDEPRLEVRLLFLPSPCPRKRLTATSLQPLKHLASSPGLQK